jgi:hypothetical protein
MEFLDTQFFFSIFNDLKLSKIYSVYVDESLQILNLLHDFQNEPRYPLNNYLISFKSLTYAQIQQSFVGQFQERGMIFTILFQNITICTKLFQCFIINISLGNLLDFIFNNITFYPKYYYYNFQFKFLTNQLEHYTNLNTILFNLRANILNTPNYNFANAMPTLSSHLFFLDILKTSPTVDVTWVDNTSHILTNIIEPIRKTQRHLYTICENLQSDHTKYIPNMHTLVQEQVTTYSVFAKEVLFLSGVVCVTLILISSGPISAITMGSVAIVYKFPLL